MLIGSGELSCATGSMEGAQAHATTMCFSDDPQVMAALGASDGVARASEARQQQVEACTTHTPAHSSHALARPCTPLRALTRAYAPLHALRPYTPLQVEAELHAVLRSSAPRPGTAGAPMELTEVEAPREAGGGADRSVALALGDSLGLCDSVGGRPEPGVRDSLTFGVRESLGYTPSAARPEEEDQEEEDEDEDDEALRLALAELPSPPRAAARPAREAATARTAEADALGGCAPPEDRPAHSAPGVGSAAGDVPHGGVLHCTILGTWGDPHYHGLAALELLDAAGAPLVLRGEQVSADPADLNAMQGGGSDPRTVDKLLDSSRVTTNSAHMWLAPWLPQRGTACTLTVQLPEATQLGALRVWNYNKSLDDASRGVRWLRVELDGALLSPARGFELRKAPGHAGFDFGQTLHLHSSPAEPAEPLPADPAANHHANHHAAAASWRTGKGRHVPVAQDYFAPVHPRGLSIRLRLLTSWGDPHYLGLDALQLFGADGEPLRMHCGTAPPPRDRADRAELRVHATPADINSLPGVHGDPRTADKLFAPPAEHASRAPSQARKPPADVWLAPWQPEQINELYFYAESAVSLGLLRVLNYSKSWARGVRDFELLVDDMLVYQGELRAAAADGTGAAWQSVLLTDARELLQQEAPRVHHAKGDHDHVLLINSGQVVSRAAPAAPARAQGHAKGAADAPRPSTAVPKRA